MYNELKCLIKANFLKNLKVIRIFKTYVPNIKSNHMFQNKVYRKTGPILNIIWPLGSRLIQIKKKP